MKSIDIAPISQAKYLGSIETDHLYLNIQEESEVLISALESKGLNVIRVAWDDPGFDWSSVKVGIIRETWDYIHRLDEFKGFLKDTATKTLLINPVDQLFWNMDKHYLQDLSTFGINIPETVFIEKGDRRSLIDLFDSCGWDKAVIKPAISATSRHTYSIEKCSAEEYEDLFRHLIKEETILFQRFQESVLDIGEKTFVLIRGKYTHAVLKKVKPGDFRVQDDFGGTVEEYTASAEEVVFAEEVIKKINPTPIYGRVDVILDHEGKMAVQEVELIEPELWFRHNHEAAKRLADEVASYLERMEYV